jgi:tRNA G18 (ribose-2'-O)-methylase SpoU
MDKLTGPHAVLEALASGRPLQTVLVARGRHGGRLEEIVRLAKRNGVPVRFEDRVRLDQVAGTREHQGVLALVASSATVSLEDLLALARRARLDCPVCCPAGRRRRPAKRAPSSAPRWLPSCRHHHPGTARRRR